MHAGRRGAEQQPVRRRGIGSEVVHAPASAVGAVAEVARRQRRKRERGGGAGDTRLCRIDERAQRRRLRVKQENCCLGQAEVLLPCEAHRRLGGFQVQERQLVHDDMASVVEGAHHPLRVVRVGPRDVNQVGPCGREGLFVVRVPAVDRAVPINAAGRPVPAVAARCDRDATDRGDGPRGGQHAPPDDTGIAEEQQMHGVASPGRRDRRARCAPRYSDGCRSGSACSVG